MGDAAVATCDVEHEMPKAFQCLVPASRYKVLYGGRGGGKSWAVAKTLLLKGSEGRLRILCTREYQGSIKDSVHKLLADLIDSMQLNRFYTVTRDAIVGANGTEFFFLGIKHDPHKIKSTEGIDICWIEEADAVSHESWKLLIPTIRKSGSEIWVTFNPHLATDSTYRRFIIAPPRNAMVKKVSWRDNPWFTQELKDEMEHDFEVDEDEANHIWEGEIKQYAEGAIYAKQLRKAKDDDRITHIPIENTEVFTFWDLGKNDHTAIWFMQRVGLQNRFIDYYENRLVDLEHYAKVLKEKDYLYGDHYLPHDAEFEILGMQQTRSEMLEDLGVKPVIIVPRINHINEGIEITRKAFASCWFDEVRCDRGLAALASYQYTYDDKNATHRMKPLHNWASNGADAFRQFAQGFKPDDDAWEDLDVNTDWID